MVAHSFITKIVFERESVIPDEEVRRTIQADHKIITTSLDFIDDFVKSMLLLYRSSANQLEVERAPTNLYSSVLEPVKEILNTTNEYVQVTVDCPEDLWIMTDAFRLKQILLNLGTLVLIQT